MPWCSLQVWRLITPFLVVGGLSLRTLFTIIWMYARVAAHSIPRTPHAGSLRQSCVCRVQYGQALESNTFADSTADFAYMLIVCMIACLVSPECATVPCKLLPSHP